MRLELKHIAPYLPYRLKARLSKDGIFNLDSEYPNQYINEICTINNFYLINGEISGSMVVDKSNKNYGFYFDNLSEVDVILRPLNDLNKEIEVNGKNVVPINLFYSFTTVDLKLIDINEWHEELIHNLKNNYPFQLSQFNILFELHFDVFGLIEKGLAIDINTL